LAATDGLFSANNGRIKTSSSFGFYKEHDSKTREPVRRADDGGHFGEMSRNL
jgi:hypothetical protein